MVDRQTIDAKILSRMFLAGAKNLEAKKEWINELNVFPVPDGDTGTNMSLTIMAAAKEVADKLQNDWQSKYNVIKNYDPDQVKIIESAKVETNGLYVSLVISEKADQIKQIYNDAIGA